VGGGQVGGGQVEGGVRKEFWRRTTTKGPLASFRKNFPQRWCLLLSGAKCHNPMLTDSMARHHCLSNMLQGKAPWSR
jgi:hypothetical protein